MLDVLPCCYPTVISYPMNSHHIILYHFIDSPLPLPHSRGERSGLYFDIKSSRDFDLPALYVLEDLGAEKLQKNGKAAPNKQKKNSKGAVSTEDAERREERMFHAMILHNDIFSDMFSCANGSSIELRTPTSSSLSSSFSSSSVNPHRLDGEVWWFDAFSSDTH